MFMEDGAGIMTKRSQEEENKEYKMFKPLSVIVWVAISMAIILMGMLYFVVNRFSPYSEIGSGEVKNDKTNRTILANSMWVIYGAFVEQGMSILNAT